MIEELVHEIYWDANHIEVDINLFNKIYAINNDLKKTSEQICGKVIEVIIKMKLISNNFLLDKNIILSSSNYSDDIIKHLSSEEYLPYDIEMRKGQVKIDIKSINKSKYKSHLGVSLINKTKYKIIKDNIYEYFEDIFRFYNMYYIYEIKDNIVIIDCFGVIDVNSAITSIKNEWINTYYIDNVNEKPTQCHYDIKEFEKIINEQTIMMYISDIKRFNKCKYREIEYDKI